MIKGGYKSSDDNDDDDDDDDDDDYKTIQNFKKELIDKNILDIDGNDDDKKI